MLNDLSIVVCSYETPNILYSCFQSFVSHHKNEKLPLIVVENSKNDETQKILDKNNIFYVKNPGGTHSPSVDIGLDLVKTKYCLLIDSDIIFQNNIQVLYDLFIQNNLTIMGEMQESRGGYDLYPRISPHACFINMDNIRRFGIKFHDQERIDKTSSNGFFGNIPLQKNIGVKHYDVGSTFLEDIQSKGLKVGKINQKLLEYVFHAEGISWRTKSNIPQYVEWGERVEQEFLDKTKIYKNIHILGKFK